MGQCQSMQVSHPVEEECHHNDHRECVKSSSLDGSKPCRTKCPNSSSPSSSVTASTTCTAARLSNDWGIPDCSETSHSTQVMPLMAKKKSTRIQVQETTEPSSAPVAPVTVTTESAKVNVNQQLSDSAHRRSTLAYQSARRQELEREASCRLAANQSCYSSSTTPSSSFVTKKTNSRPALRMPPSSNKTTANRRPMLARADSWFTLSYASDSDMGVHDLEDYSYGVNNDDTAVEEPSDMLSSWSAMDANNHSSVDNQRNGNTTTTTNSIRRRQEALAA
ncbi:expressed unknown protein [Seminavis robusta]|uniref:Uncharacterized protein n=1 Tax=Seminavis robusta TaxID=568900 RepID=A0A9N8HTA9_9STRA|nr:expressed unknown protein [Seminavis robusta]|eukprot:Sro1256_g256600.1 n/a (278) ;mRNA; r:6244-7206